MGSVSRGDELELDEQPGRAAGVVVARLAGPGAHDVGHEETDLGRGEELARALAGALRELAQQVLVGAAQEVGLHVGQAEAVAGVGEGLDDGGEPGRVELAFCVTLRREVHEVDDALESGVVSHNGADGPCQVVANVAGSGAAPLGVEGPLVGLPSTDDTPSGLRGQVEAQQLVVSLRDFLSYRTVPVLLGQPVDLIVEDIGEALEKEEW